MNLTTTKSQELQYIRALLIGDTGSGKTTSIKTLPVETTLVVLGERGALPLRDFDFPVLTFESWDDVRNIYGCLLDPDKHTEDDAVKATIKKAKTVVIDSLSEVSELCARHIVQVDRKELTIERTNKKRDTPENVYADQLTMEDYGLYRTRMTKIVSAFTHLPRHVIMTCRAQWTKDKQGGETQRTANLSGKAALEVPAYFDLVFNMKTQEGGRVWQTFNDGLIMAKDSSGVLDKYEITDWTAVFTKILKPAKKETT